MSELVRGYISNSTLSRKGAKFMDSVYTSFDQLPVIVTAEELAKLLCVSRTHAYTLMHKKGFPTLYIGNRMVVQKDHLLEWLSKQTEPK